MQNHRVYHLAEQQSYTSCKLCPRACLVNRTQGELGVCGVGAEPRIARAALHYWEEPPISGERGSGTIFFSGCPMRCVYCQNIEISREGFGKNVSIERLVQIMLELQEAGAHNINLVTALHFAPSLVPAIHRARELGLAIPIVCNTGGYELVQLVEELADCIDIWLVDYKYADNSLARKLSGIKDYPRLALEALGAMHRTTMAKGGRWLDNNGIMQRGIIMRHLVLPGHTDDSCKVLEQVYGAFGNDLDYSVMNQYTPNKAMRVKGGALGDSLSSQEYERVLDYADDLGIEKLWWQQGGTVSESFVPAFDLSGVDEHAGA